MNDEELFEKIMNRELTICETCDNIFPYIQQKQFCDECVREKRTVRKRKWRKENREKFAARSRKYYEENREKILAQKRKYNANNREKITARRRARYHAKKEK